MPSDTFASSARWSPRDHHTVAPPVSRQMERRFPAMLPSREPLVVLRQNYEWKNWSEVVIKVRGLAPDDTKTYKLWEAFSREGNVFFVELFENRQGVKDGNGKVKFAPPPMNAFWERSKNKYPFPGYHGRYFVDVELVHDKRSRGHQVQSPIKKGVWYSPKLNLVPQQLQFGKMVGPASFMSFNTVESVPSDALKDITFEVDLQHHRVTAAFNVKFRQAGGRFDRDNRYMFQIPFTSLEKIHRMDMAGGKHFALVISLGSPPQFYRKRQDNTASHTEEGLTWSEFDTWYRQTDIVYNPSELARKKVTLRKDEPVIDIGRWTTYLFKFDASKTQGRQYDTLKQALQDFNIEIETIDAFESVPPRQAELWALIDPSITSNHVSDLGALQTTDLTVSLPFEVRYQLEVCISNEWLCEHNIGPSFIKKLSDISRRDPARARNILEYVAKEGERVHDPLSLFANSTAMSASYKTEIPHYCAYARKATVTPSTVRFDSPTVETTNRVLRHYSRENLDGRFLRVQFTDERAEGRINACAEKTRNDELFSRVFRTLYNGIQIGERHYQFLAFGNSQFRENGAYFFCPTEHLSCDDIRQWMGNFSEIKVVAKYAARLGQCFSTTRAINGLSAPDIIVISDVEVMKPRPKDENDKYNFTDGVGKISPFLAQMIAAELGVRSSTAPSAFQFRLGGAKGILVVWPEAKEREVHLRKSQQKFPAIYNGLEIIRCARFSAASLNRQTITILSGLGVPDDVFVRMLTEQLADYQIAMSDNDKAVDLLLRYIDENSMTINIATMIRNGFMAERDPFVLSLLHLWRSWSIKLLKEKAKIIVENGAFVLGCVDETDTLRGYTSPSVAPGEPNIVDELPEIFIQIPDKTDPNKYCVVEGICLVGRNPSLHPGDLRVVRAVNTKALHHLRDVVVFPRNGERDIPGMCSGGDLDGDDYFVIWDKDLLPREWNCDPMSYDPPRAKNLHRPVEITDLMKFFVRFMKNDALPTIAHAHLAQSDFLEYGVKDPRCLELAALHYKAVDYVKSGEPAQMPKRLRPSKWPHFMEKKFKPKEAIYHSTKILGQLFDKVEMVNFVPQYEEPFDKRILRAYNLDSALLKTVRQVKSQYDTAMRRLMAQQEIKTEFEIWSTFVLSRPRVGSDYKMQEEMGRISDTLKHQFRAVCEEKAGGKGFDVLGPFVAAMYKVTKEELDIALAECRTTRVVGGRELPKRKMEPRFMPLISFPWLFEKELGRIATGIEVFEDPQDTGLAALAPNEKSKRRHGGGHGAREMEDFIKQEDGVIVHRGEELDLFRRDDDSDAFASEDEVCTAGDDHNLVMGDDGEVVLANDFQFDKSDVPSHLLSGTGVEEVVPPTMMDGFIDPHEAAQLVDASYYNDWRKTQSSPSSAESPVIVESRGSPVAWEHDRPRAVDASTFGPDVGEVEEDFVHLDLRESSLEKLARMRGADPRSSSPQNDTPEPGEAEEELVHVDLRESALEKLARMMGAGGSSSKGKGATDDESKVGSGHEADDEAEMEEEVVELELRDSPLEKLARMMGTDAKSSTNSDTIKKELEDAGESREAEEEVVELVLEESSLERLARMMAS